MLYRFLKPCLRTRLFRATIQSSAVLGLLLASACSNPFAGHSEKAVVPQNAFHTQTVDCNRINFSEEHLSQTQLRTIIACLNSNHEIEALDQLIRSLSDAEAKPFVDLLNSTTDLNPQVFYAVKEMYLKARADGRLSEAEALVQAILADPKKNTEVAAALKSLAPVIRELIQTQSLKLSTANLDTLASSASFQRFIKEYNQPELIHRFATSLKIYVNDPEATSVEALYNILSENLVAEAFAEFSSDPKRVQKLGSFLEWMFSDNRFQAFSETLASIREKKMTCFGGQIEIKNPLATKLRELAKMTPAEGKTFFTHDLKNLIFSSRGYCDIPYSTDGFVKFLEEATQQPGYDEIFSVLRPLMNDDRFISFLASKPAKNWMKENAFLAEQHFFQDLLTLVAQSQRAALSDNGQSVAHILDQSLKALDAKQLEALVSTLNPALSEAQQYGAKPIHLIHSLVEEFPELKTRTQPGLRSQIAQFVETILGRPQMPEVLTLTSNLIRDQKLNSMLDQTLTIFEQFLNRGKRTLSYGVMKIAKRAGNDLVYWLLDKGSVSTQAVDPCLGLNYDWDFTVYTAQNQSQYQNQLDLILKCVNPNQTFKSARGLVTYLTATTGDSYRYLLKTQKTVIDEMYNLDTPLSFQTIDHFLDLSNDQSNTVRKTLSLGSAMVQQTADSLLKKKELRSFLSRQLSLPGIYETIGEYLHSTTQPPVETPALDVMGLNQINVQVDRELYFANEPFASALDKLFKMYCPTLDSNDPSCDVDDDQVALYKNAPAELVNSIKTEFLNSTQSWLHPKAFKGWHHTHAPVETVSDFEYHMNPLLHLMKNGSNSVNSVFSAVNRIQKHHYDLNRFLKDRAVRLTLIPYIYQVPNYPQNDGREYHDRIRLRIVSDLDRLELLAINADFKAFGLVQNMGMGFIREIGLSWADLPQSEWPKSLAQMKPAQNVRTLKEARDYIYSEMGKFDKGIIQKMGECDPRGKGRIHRWFQRRLCSDEIFDISSRLFNLRFLISLLDRELLEKDNSSGGLAFLRDLFYSLYEANQLNQFDQLGNGVNVADVCLSDPSLSAAPLPACNKDLLTMIPRITRLGLLHQVGMTMMKNQNTASQSLVRTLNKLAPQTKITQKLADFVSTPDGIKTLQSGVDFGFESGEKTSAALAASVPLLDLIPNQNWVSALIDLVRQYPEVLKDDREVVEAALSGDGSTLRNITASIVQTPNAKALSWINDLSLNLNDALITELAGSLRELKPKASTLAPIVRSFYQLTPVNSSDLTQTMARWTDLLASEKARATRARLSSWAKESGFDEFCDVFSDSQFVDKTYNFLEEVHQNPDSRDFFKSCKQFMNVH
jgi:hypothetical protein